MRVIGLVFGISAWAMSAWAAEANEPKGYVCALGAGAAQVYGKGAFKAETASPLTLEIGDIDPAQQSAVQKSAKGEGPLRVVRAVGALHFLEVVSEGYLNITTVYDKDAVKGAHPAVHSRHFGVLGEPVISQYHGFCNAK
jgi:hypothetical protein